MFGHCCHCAEVNDFCNLKHYEHDTGDVVWQRLEQNPTVDEAGDVWTTRTEQISSSGDVSTIAEVQTGFANLPKPGGNKNYSLYQQYVRKIDGPLGSLLAEYGQIVNRRQTAESLWGDNYLKVNYGEIINSSGQCLLTVDGLTSSDGTNVQVLFENLPESGSTGLTTYYIGPTVAARVSQFTFRVGTYPGTVSLPAGVTDAVVNPTDSAATIQGTLSTAFGDAATSVAVTSGTGATINTGQMKIVVQWGHPEWYLAQLKITRSATARATGGFVWDTVNAVVDSHGEGTYRSTPSDPDTNVWGPDQYLRWCDNGSVSSLAVDTAWVSNANYWRMVNWDVSGASFSSNWDVGIFDATANPTDLDVATSGVRFEPLPHQFRERGHWAVLGLNTAGGYSRAWYSNLREGSPQFSQESDFRALVDYSTQVADAGTGWQRYTGTWLVNGAEGSAVFGGSIGWGKSSQKDVMLTSSTQSGFVIHAPEEMQLYFNDDGLGWGTGPRPAGKMFARHITNHSARFDDGATTNAAQKPQAGLATHAKRPQGFDTTHIYVAGEVDDPTKNTDGSNKPEPVMVATTLYEEGIANKGFIDQYFDIKSTVGGPYWDRRYYIAATEQFAVDTCQWRIKFHSANNPLTPTYTSWYEHDDNLATVNTSLVAQFGTDVAMSFFGGGPSDQPVWFTEVSSPPSQGMVWQHDVVLNQAIPAEQPLESDPALYTAPNLTIPKWWRGSYGPPNGQQSGMLTMECDIELRHVVRLVGGEIGRIAWDGLTSDWSKDWSASQGGVYWGRLHGEKYYVHGPDVPCEAPRRFLDPNGNGVAQEWVTPSYVNVDDEIRAPDTGYDGNSCLSETDPGEVNEVEWTVEDLPSQIGNTTEFRVWLVSTGTRTIDSVNCKIDGSWQTLRSSADGSNGVWDYYSFAYAATMASGITGNEIRITQPGHTDGNYIEIESAYIEVITDQ